jgi:hypothetical protein
VIFAAAYMLWAIQRVLFNPLSKPENKHIPDLNWREIAIWCRSSLRSSGSASIPRRFCGEWSRLPPRSLRMCRRAWQRSWNDNNSGNESGEHTVTLDLSIPGQLMNALGPDLLLMTGAMILLLWSAWRRRATRCSGRLAWRA